VGANEVKIEGKRNVNLKGLSPRYAAPEIFARSRLKEISLDLKSEQKADIYSVAIVFWEITMQRVPWSDLTAEEIEVEVRQGRRPTPFPDESDSKMSVLAAIFTACFHAEPEARPQIKEILQRLTVMQQWDV